MGQLKYKHNYSNSEANKMSDLADDHKTSLCEAVLYLNDAIHNLHKAINKQQIMLAQKFTKLENSQQRVFKANREINKILTENLVQLEAFLATNQEK